MFTCDNVQHLVFYVKLLSYYCFFYYSCAVYIYIFLHVLQQNIPYISFVCAYYVSHLHLHSSINIWQQNNSNGKTTEISSYTCSSFLIKDVFLRPSWLICDPCETLIEMNLKMKKYITRNISHWATTNTCGWTRCLIWFGIHKLCRYQPHPPTSAARSKWENSVTSLFETNNFIATGGSVGVMKYLENLLFNQWGSPPQRGEDLKC